jgi:class 3 adenylate cyclase/tetratricopeptide (TPR) repeat protein
MVKCGSCGEENPPKFRLCGYCGAPLAAAAPALPVRELRKTVTLLFCDLKGSTALGEVLDAEALHEVKERYFRAMSSAIARHGGRVEKYIGDAIMAVFGLPRAHEDDALRAVRAAADMNAALDGVNAGLLQRYGVKLANRTGVNTGEVVTNDDPTADQKLATGDAVNVCARLEQAAPENQIYLGESTWRLVRDAVEAEAVEPLELKGKSQRIPAWRLVSAKGLEGNARRLDTPLVGRDDELARIDALRAALRAERRPHLVTVVGEAGMGKSRLVHEAVLRAGAGVRVLRGRCLPYGDGITFWPLLMMVREAASIDETDAPEQARAKLLAAAGDAEVAERLASAVGLSTAAFPLPELNWAARRFLEAQAAGGLLIAVVDDIHWAEPAFLELLEYAAAGTAGATLLLLATARPDFVDGRPEWGCGERATRIVLQPLSEAAASQVVAHVLGASGLPAPAVARIVQAAEGNPLYVEQILSMLIDNGTLRWEQDRWLQADADAAIAVPPTIHALLEARLDALGRAERATVEGAAVIGLEFVRPAVEALAPAPLRATLDNQLAALVRQRFVMPSRQVERDAVYRFHHHLVRETVYGGLLKRARATLHLEFVRWADRVNAEAGRALEFEAIMGYHLEQAHRYLAELGPLDDEGRAIGVDGSTRLARAGRRAFARGDMHAAAGLLGRAAALRPPGDAERPALRSEHGEVLMELGRFDTAREVLDAAIEEAALAGNARVRAGAHLLRLRVRVFSGEPGDWSEAALTSAHEAVPLFEREDAHGELARAWRLIGFIHGVAGRYGDSTDAVTRALDHARRAGDERLVARSAMGLSISALLGPTPVAQAIEQCERILAEKLRDRQAEAKTLCTLAQLRAMTGAFDEARTLVRRARGLLADLGHNVAAASTAIDLLGVELLAGDLAAAEREARRDLEFLTAAGETYVLSTVAALLSRVVRDQGRDVDAMALSRTAEEASAEDDIESQALWRAVRAPMLARGGALAEAEALARSALDFARQTDARTLQADALIELASVLAVAGRGAEARAGADEAVAIYAAKGDRISQARWSAWAATLS